LYPAVESIQLQGPELTFSLDIKWSRGPGSPTVCVRQDMMMKLSGRRPLSLVQLNILIIFCIADAWQFLVFWGIATFVGFWYHKNQNLDVKQEESLLTHRPNKFSRFWLNKFHWLDHHYFMLQQLMCVVSSGCCCTIISCILSAIFEQAVKAQNYALHGLSYNILSAAAVLFCFIIKLVIDRLKRSFVAKHERFSQL